MPVSSIGYFTEQGASMVGVGGPMDLYDPSRIVPFWRQWQCRICGEVRFVEGTSASHPPLRACAWCGKEGSDWVSVDVDLKDKPLNICCRKQPPKVAPVRVPAGTFPRGNHKALLIGLNYYGQGTDLELKGSIQDVHAMTQFLTFQGWHTDADHLRVLVDDRSTPLPTRQAIVEGIQWLMAGADPGSNLFLRLTLYADHSALQKLNEAQITALLDLTPDLPADPILMEGAGAANAPKPPCGHSNCSDRDCCRVFQQYNARRRPQTSLAMVPVL